MIVKIWHVQKLKPLDFIIFYDLACAEAQIVDFNDFKNLACAETKFF